MKPFQLEIITPERTIFSGAVGSVVVPATGGRMGILANHAALVGSLEPGTLKITMPDGTVRLFAIGGGFVDVANNEARIVADSGERADEIDEERARRAEERARERLKERAEDLDLARAEAALERAVARLDVMRELKRYSMGGGKERAQTSPH